MSDYRLIGAIVPVMALFSSISSAQNITVNVCMGNGGGPSCISKDTVNYTCAQYRAIGGGGTATETALGSRFCKVYDANGQQKQLPFNVVVKYDVGGGECGWTLFSVTCLTSQ